MFQTKITEKLGIKYPIVGGTMQWISTPEFTAAVSNGGCLGVLSSAMYQSREAFSEALDRLQALTDQPFAVNINLFPMKRPVDNNDYVDLLIEKGVKIVETSGHFAPQELVARFKAGGLIWIHKCVGVRYALKVQDMGADIVTLVGYENGGATGKLDIGTMALVPRVAEKVNIPLIGGGGVSDGRGFLAVLALGAEGVIIGTRLLATQEAPLHGSLKQALVDATETDTTLILRSIGNTPQGLGQQGGPRMCGTGGCPGRSGGYPEGRWRGQGQGDVCRRGPERRRHPLRAGHWDGPRYPDGRRTR